MNSWLATGLVQVFDAEKNLPALIAGAAMGGDKGVGVSEVKVPGGRGGEPGDEG